MQPPPQEPAYTSATYKPPSLYPQKKQRTEYHLEPVPPFSAHEINSPPLFASDAYSRRSHRAPTNELAVSPQSRQLSIQPLLRNPPNNSPGYSSRPPQASFVHQSPSRDRATGDDHLRGTYGSAMSPPDVRVTRQLAPNEKHARGRLGHPFERRDSTQGHYDPVHQANNHQQRPTVPPTLESPAHTVRRNVFGVAQYEPPGQVAQAERPRESPFTPYQPSQSSVFMPSQYDYRQGRARKRSNLPKQSTEIMKTWFDQVRSVCTQMITAC